MEGSLVSQVLDLASPVSCRYRTVGCFVRTWKVAPSENTVTRGCGYVLLANWELKVILSLPLGALKVVIAPRLAPSQPFTFLLQSWVGNPEPCTGYVVTGVASLATMEV